MAHYKKSSQEIDPEQYVTLTSREEGGRGSLMKKLSLCLKVKPRTIWIASAVLLFLMIATAISGMVVFYYSGDKLGILQILKTKFPLIYDDFESTKLDDDTNSWKPKYLKV